MPLALVAAGTERQFLAGFEPWFLLVLPMEPEPSEQLRPCVAAERLRVSAWFLQPLVRFRLPVERVEKTPLSQVVVAAERLFLAGFEPWLLLVLALEPEPSEQLRP